MDKEINEYYLPLLKYISKRVKNRHDAEDLTQDVFYKLSVADKSDIGNLKSWIYTIARNSIIDYYRTKKDNTTTLDDTYISDNSAPEAYDIAELGRCIVPFIEKLPEDYKTVITLSELEGIPQKDIATILNMNYTTVRSRVQRGRAKLKKMFTNCCSFEFDEKRNRHTLSAKPKKI
ncbi:MAG: sigma-70 family RNA polymerase sigma factor [Bacteroidales bacterium]|jgi:RNA polymerase sigma-70 factor (ECF subfamily)|nr:sigma-70 family RNA polymerase sigma factor [Bacteroidales bacterium]